MIKRFCDCCGDEIVDSNRIDPSYNNRFSAGIKKHEDGAVLTVEVVTAKDATWNAGDFCKYCIIDAVNEADDRPRHARYHDSINL